MQKKIILPIMVCLLSAQALTVPVHAEESNSSDISFESLVSNFQTQKDNYGKIGDENVDIGYQTYLKNVSSSAALLAEKFEDFNDYNYENLDIYKEIETVYQEALKSQEDLSKSTLEAFEKAKEEAKNKTISVQEEADQAFNEFSSKISTLKSEIEKMKASVTSGAQAAAAKKYSNSSSEYSAVMSKIKSGQGINYYNEQSFYDMYNKEKSKLDAAIIGSNGTMNITSALQQNLSNLGLDKIPSSFGMGSIVSSVGKQIAEKVKQ